MSEKTSAQPLILRPSHTERGYDHCACPTDGISIAPTPATQISDLWGMPSELMRIPLPEQHESVFNPFGAAGLVVLNQPARAILDAFYTPHDLLSNFEQELAALDILTPTTGHHPDLVTRIPPPSMLTAWLHLTNACNLRCSYCYLQKTDEEMDEETGRQAINAIFASAISHGYTGIKLKYAGGEASLNFALLRKLHEQAEALATANGIVLHEVVLSNGIALTPAMLDYMHAASIQLSISLDGLATAHDVQRAFMNGRGSADQVRKGIERAIAHGVKPHLTITVTTYNADDLADTVLFALQRGLHFNLNFYIQHLALKTPDQLQADNDRLISGLRRAFRVIEQHLPKTSLLNIIDRADLSLPHTKSCGAGENYLVIDQSGDVARCHIEIIESVSSVRSSNLLADIQMVDRSFNAPVDDRAGCQECQWRYWCGGGCSVMTSRSFGDGNVSSPYCSVYKAVYPELLRLEGLRVLKQSEQVQ